MSLAPLHLFTSKRLARDHLLLPPEQAVEQLLALGRTYRATRFDLVDEALPPAFLEAFCHRLVALDQRFDWTCNLCLSPDLASPGLARLIARAGCRRVVLGLEAAVPRTLQRMGKPHRCEEVPAILRSLRGAGLTVVLNLLLGFPGETRDEVHQTLEFLEGHRDLFHHLCVAVFSLDDGSEVFSRPAHYGVTGIDREDKYLTRRFGYRYRTEDGLSREELETVIRGLYRRFHRTWPDPRRAPRVGRSRKSDRP